MTQDEILDPEVGNPNFELLFEDDSYSRGSNKVINISIHFMIVLK
jgi:hypothetical protein